MASVRVGPRGGLSPGGRHSRVASYDFSIGCSECKHVFELHVERFDLSSSWSILQELATEERSPGFYHRLKEAVESAVGGSGHYRAIPDGYMRGDWRDGCPALASQEKKA